jgi:hypothetical protein
VAYNTIRIKRSPANTSGAYNPPTLRSGELAYSYRSGTLWVGPTDEASVIENVRIGGQMNPGTLTSNQALVANNTGGIDRVIADSVELGKLKANNSFGNPGYILTSAGSSSNAYWMAASILAVNPDAQYTWTNTMLYTNIISFSQEIRANVINAFSVNTGSGYGTSTGGVVINSTAIGIGNTLINGTITWNSSNVFFSGVANNSASLGGIAAASYVTTSALNTSLSSYSTTTTMTSAIATAKSQTIADTDAKIATANTAMVANATAAYNNSKTYIDSAISVANTAMVANALAAYTNAVAKIAVSTANNALYLGGYEAALFVNTQNFAANLVNYASLGGALFTGTINAVSYNTGGTYGTPVGGIIVNTNVIAVGNSSVNGAISTNATVAFFTGTSYNANSANNAAYLGGQPAAVYANTQYVDNAFASATSGGATQAYADNKAANAYSNAVSYTDGKISTANTAMVANAAAAYANAVTYINSKADTTYTTATSTANTYTNLKNAEAIAYAYAQAQAARTAASQDMYSNNSGVFNGITRFTSNVTFSDDIIVSGSQNINAGESNLSILNVTVSGNLSILGTLTTIDTENIRIEDASLQLASNQALTSTFTDSYDISVFGTFGNTANTWFTGIYRDHTSSSHYSKNVWKLYAANNVNILTTNSSVVDQSSIYYNQGTLQAYLEPYGNTSTSAFVANSSAVTITSAVKPVYITANTLALNTALTPSNGGTGLKLYNIGDIIFANSSTTFDRLQVTIPGDILQISDTNLPIYKSLDGGIF